jgi:hypothetical protein
LDGASADKKKWTAVKSCPADSIYGVRTRCAPVFFDKSTVLTVHGAGLARERATKGIKGHHFFNRGGP